ncbi:hypothetical protein GOODEAATRI_033084 [Goodea atripinnis]|uniref:Uncharacterized protein n=1 Tax=Goodea atripinnis TaxID=208336 RepID=A0ABV0NQ58_9TELE
MASLSSFCDQGSAAPVLCCRHSSISNNGYPVEYLLSVCLQLLWFTLNLTITCHDPPLFGFRVYLLSLHSQLFSVHSGLLDSFCLVFVTSWISVSLFTCINSLSPKSNP